MDCSTPGFPVHYQLTELAQTHVHRVSDAIQPSHPLSSSSPPAFNLSQHQSLFQGVSSLHQVAKVLKFHLQHHECSGLISFRMDWLDLLAVRGTLKSLLQHRSSIASILWCLAFFIVRHSHPCMTTGKAIGLTRRKIMSAFLEHKISHWASTCGSDFNYDTFYSLEGSTVYWEDSSHPGVELPILKSWLCALTKLSPYLLKENSSIYFIG